MFAVISDIHSNLEALNSVLLFLKQNGIEEIYCTGDLVGYGPNPNEVVDIIRQEGIPCCLGNHDAAVIGKTNIVYFNDYAREAVLWTRERISKDNFLFLSTLPYFFVKHQFRFVHGSPEEPHKWYYITNFYDAEIAQKFFPEPICFIGHTHRPAIFSEKQKQNLEKSVELVRGEKYIINAGSVGQPRDGDPRAVVLIFDPEKYIASYTRIGYDVDRVRFKILQAGLPEYLGERLRYGR